MNIKERLALIELCGYLQDLCGMLQAESGLRIDYSELPIKIGIIKSELEKVTS